MENQRVRITKKLLADSLIHLLGEKNIHKISVREICDDAGINRTTFYKHYKDQYDLLGEIENNVLILINQNLSINSPESDDLLKLLVFIEENINLFKILLSNRIGSNFLEKLLSFTTIQQLIYAQISSEHNEQELSYISDFIIYGGKSIIERWIYQENRESPAEIKKLIDVLMGRLLPM